MKYTINKPEDYQKIALPGLTKWVTALRSGKYSQGTLNLCSISPEGNYEYCCLGVLSSTQNRLHSIFKCNSLLVDICSPKYKDNYPIKAGGLASDNPLFNILSGYGIFPKGVIINSPGLSDTDQCLANLNDSKKFTFNDIADILEELYYEPEDTQVSKTYS